MLLVDGEGRIKDEAERKRQLIADVAEFERAFRTSIDLQNGPMDNEDYVNLACNKLHRLLDEKGKDELTLRYNDFAEAVTKGNGYAAGFALRSIFRLEKQC